MTVDIIFTKQSGLTLPSANTTVTLFTNKVTRHIIAETKPLNMPVIPGLFGTDDASTLILDLKKRKRTYTIKGYLQDDTTTTALLKMEDLVEICMFGGVFQMQYVSNANTVSKQTFNVNLDNIEIVEIGEDRTAPSTFEILMTVNVGEDLWTT